MKRAAISRIAVVGIVVALVAVGCSKKKADEEGLEGGSGDSEFSDGSSSSTGSDDDAAMGEPERVRELGSVYFDYDSASIRGDARTTLKANAQAISGRSEWKIDHARRSHRRARQRGVQPRARRATRERGDAVPRRSRRPDRAHRSR